jgi:short-subunit dehydrogenase
MTIDYQGQTALITGASSGMGAEFARALAKRGANVVLVARREPLLQTLADSLRNDHGVEATVIARDLTEPEIGTSLLSELTDRKITIHTLINNAGFATYGPFGHENAARISAEIRLDVLALVDITRAFIPSLLSAATGALVNVASTASFQAVPNMAVYGASKAFVLSFTEALAYEYRKSGLRVLALCPGATQTEFFDVVGTDQAAVGRRQTPEQVVATAMKALDKPHGSSSVVSGASNRFGAILAGLVPRSAAIAVTARVMSTS